ncbi:Hypothetical protein PENO1_051540 [Penicillium occitanis (nom. inval.)]|nr:Hypothetical protein PENO1_051540 [Penicillium occitanis (nom. inval.)]PCH06295.1 hypothetical protein PENOC_024490 [Penicillium occitanis (nom. inval.)]
MATAGMQKSPMVTLEFVNITNPVEIHDPQNQSMIRRKARKRDTKKTLSRQKTSQIIKTSQSLGPRNDEPPEQDVSSGAYSRPRFDITTSYPAGPFPMKLSSRAAQIVTFVMQGGDGNHCPLKELWWNMGLLDSTAFLITLANASRVIGRYTPCGVQETPEAITYYTRSVRALQRRIDSLEERLSEGVIVAVLEFAYYDISTFMILLRRIDVSGSFIFDRKPYFAPPYHLLHDMKQTSPPSPLLVEWIDNLPELLEAIAFSCEAANLAAFIDTHFNGCQVMEDDKFLSRTFNIYVHKLLSLPRLDDFPETGLFAPHLVVQEAHEIDWTPYLKLRLWVLAIASLAADGEEVQWYVHEICGTTTQLGLLDWDEVLDILRQILWMGETFKNEEKSIRERFELVDSF